MTFSRTVALHIGLSTACHPYANSCSHDSEEDEEEPESESESDGEDEVSSPAQPLPKVRTGRETLIRDLSDLTQRAEKLETSVYDSIELPRGSGQIAQGHVLWLGSVVLMRSW